MSPRALAQPVARHRARLGAVVLLLSLFLVSVYLPLAVTVYTPGWYTFNCRFHTRCERFGEETVARKAGELARYFRHGGELGTRWTAKERAHLAEVRDIYDRLVVVFLVAVALLALTFDPRRAARCGLANALVVLGLLLVLPFFKPFWRDVFHPLLFDNELWRNTRQDVSYWFMPKVFFRNSVALIVVSAAFLNLALWLGLRRRSAAGGD